MVFNSGVVVTDNTTNGNPVVQHVVSINSILVTAKQNLSVVGCLVNHNCFRAVITFLRNTHYTTDIDIVAEDILCIWISNYKTLVFKVANAYAVCTDNSSYANLAVVSVGNIELNGCIVGVVVEHTCINLTCNTTDMCLCEVICKS